MKKINRRDFLKLAGTASASLALQHIFPNSTTRLKNDGSIQNVIIILFDTMSAAEFIGLWIPEKHHTQPGTFCGTSNRLSFSLFCRKLYGPGDGFVPDRHVSVDPSRNQPNRLDKTGL